MLQVPRSQRRPHINGSTRMESRNTWPWLQWLKDSRDGVCQTIIVRSTSVAAGDDCFLALRLHTSARNSPSLIESIDNMKAFANKCICEWTNSGRWYVRSSSPPNILFKRYCIQHVFKSFEVPGHGRDMFVGALQQSNVFWGCPTMNQLWGALQQL